MYFPKVAFSVQKGYSNNEIMIIIYFIIMDYGELFIITQIQNNKIRLLKHIQNQKEFCIINSKSIILKNFFYPLFKSLNVKFCYDYLIIIV